MHARGNAIRSFEVGINFGEDFSRWIQEFLWIQEEDS